MVCVVGDRLGVKTGESGKPAPPRARLLRSNLERMMALAIEAAQDGGREVCGLLVNKGDFLEPVQVRNKCRTGGGFAFYVGEVRAITKTVAGLDHEIVGTFHSHPVGVATPGRSDIHHAVDDSLMLICDVTGREWALWHILGHQPARVEFEMIALG